MLKLSKSVVVAAALFTGTAALANDTVWVISETDGQVSVIRDSKAIYGAEGTQLQTGDIVRTSKAGRAVLVRGKEFHMVEPDAQVRIAKVEKSNVTKVMEFFGSMLSPGKKQTSTKQPMQAAIVKGYGSDKKENSVLAAADAKMGLTEGD
ncbi:hypothetical protein [Erythrobacter crassostreae]|uniref:FecR protein domain-containing protein n=1 Tax=Erythrobacter crassostreae TaxID=2828328 RepID=A0A9X1F3E6_9SPHN|nr:hypothetical protein [Erythrobacter crassostrea]MBV7258763.1 hypothetical protein [Erythrobacter crassostrea]